MPRRTLEAVIVILLLLWVIGAFTPFAFGGSLVHLLLLIVLVVVVIRLMDGRRPLG